MNPGLFRNVIGPWARRMGQGAMGWGRGAGIKGFNTIKSNAGFGWRALKGNPGRMMGVNQLRGMGRVARQLRPGNIESLGPELGYMGKRWMMGGEFTTGRMRDTAMMLRGGGTVGGIAGGMAAADFLNPWGLGWGD